MKRVQVRFSGTGPLYTYLTDIEGIEVGDHVVVDSPSTGYTLVQVAATDETLEGIKKATKWVVDRVDVGAYEDRLRKETERAAIVAELKRIQSRVLEENQFAALAAASPEAFELVERLRALV